MKITEGETPFASIQLPTQLAKHKARTYLKIALDHYNISMRHTDFVTAALLLKAFANKANEAYISIWFSNEN